MKAFSVLLLCLTAAAAVSSNNTQRIIGGSRARIEDFPYQLSMSDEGTYYCSASIISANWALTAASCTYERDFSDITIRAGSADNELNGTVHSIKRVIQHPMFDNAYHDYDFALIEVAEPFINSTTVQAVKLADLEPLDGTVVKVAGWGETWNGNSVELEFIEVKTINRRECISKYGVTLITNRMICAQEDKKDACDDDTGAPLVDVKTGEQVGIVSWGQYCADPAYPRVYSSIADQRRWIREQTGI